MKFPTRIETAIEDVIGFMHLDLHIREVMRGTSLALVIKALGSIARFVFNIILARLLGAEEAGIYFLALTVCQVANLIGQMGLDNILLRHASVGLAEQNWPRVAGVTRQTMLITACTSIMVTVLLVVTAPWIAGRVFSKPEMTSSLQIIVLSILPVSLLRVYTQLLRAAKRIGESTVLEGVGFPLTNTLLLVVLVFAGAPSEGAIAYLVSNTLMMLVGVGLWYRAAPNLRGLSGAFSESGQMVRSGLPFLALNVMDLGRSLSDTALVGVWLSSEAVGVYGIAKRTSLLIGFALMSINVIIAPKFAVLYAQKDHVALRKLARNATLLSILIALPVVLLFVATPRLILSIFGNGYVSGANVLIILTIGQFIFIATGPVEFLLMMTGHEKSLQNNILASLIVTLILQIVFIPKYGIVGAAIANTLGLVLGNLVSVWLVYAHLSISVFPNPFHGRKSPPSLPLSDR